ncbi:serine hydrolase [Erythrobacter sp.]|uniref:serine hydrolase domain-containing protein n=1 Tax=Erythrobacter sp. TaxID=1042 RepID=UPI001425FA61|nr:serine hydrolase domain-containing protein [Erythrobacter sp.]QIQ85654.1 MAG: beta-lactamase family protein [Erythrobacter sp.]
MAFRDFDSPDVSRRSLLRLTGYGAAAAALSGLPFGRVLTAHDVSESWPNVAALAERYVSKGKLANMLLTFGWRKDEHAHLVARGTLTAGGTAQADEDSLYRIYSMTKPITGMAAMTLVDEGKLGLDQPLHDILPVFRDMQVLLDPEGPLDRVEPAIRPITIRQLMTHTSGLGYDIVSKGPLQQAYRDAGVVSGQVSKMPIPGFPDVTPAPGLEAFADRLAEIPLMYQPATKWSYSFGLDVLGRVIEVVSGQSYDAFLQERFFGPLGMTSTFFRVPQSEVSRLTTNYGILNGTPLPLDLASNSIFAEQPPILWGGSGLVSTPRDYDRFLNMVLNHGMFEGKRVMGELAVRVGTSDLIPATVDKTGSWSENEGHGAGGRVRGRTWGWGGAAGTIAAVDYGLGLRTTLFTQYMPSEAYPVREEFLAALEADLEGINGKKAA